MEIKKENKENEKTQAKLLLALEAGLRLSKIIMPFSHLAASELANVANSSMNAAPRAGIEKTLISRPEQDTFQVPRRIPCSLPN